MERLKCDFYLSEESVDEFLKRLSRIEGQVRGMRKIIEDRRSCDEILVQISAVKSALNFLMLRLIEERGGSGCACSVSPRGGGDSQDCAHSKVLSEGKRHS